MILGIDASNLRRGGGVTHLVELLRAADPLVHGFSRVFVWAGQATLDSIEDRAWLTKVHLPVLERGTIARVIWQRVKLSAMARAVRCDLLFVPGGSFSGDFRPIVTMSRNLLPFEWRELLRFGWSLMTIKLTLLRLVQSMSLKRASGVIFLTQYARDVVMNVVKTVDGQATIVPHGVSERFYAAPRPQMNIDTYSSSRPFRVLYVSIIDMYKHQWHVVEAVAMLRAAGLPVELELVGPAYGPALRKLRTALRNADPDALFVRYVGALSYRELSARYASAELCVFASSCENMPNILLEGMASGLPIACSHCGPMPEILGAAGLYFDPERPADIARCLRELIASPALRAEKAGASFAAAHAYSWARCAEGTLAFFKSVITKSCVG